MVFVKLNEGLLDFLISMNFDILGALNLFFKDEADESSLFINEIVEERYKDYIKALIYV